LARNANDWHGEAEKKCTPRYDIRSEILIGGRATFAKERQIAEPIFRLPPELAAWGRQIAADQAFYRQATAEHPAGYLLRGVRSPELANLKSQSLDDRPLLLSPADTPWLQPNECFVVSAVTFEQLAAGSSWRQFLSTRELVTGIRGQVIEAGADVRMILHNRLIQPLLDVSLVLMGIPLVLSRATRNIFVAGIMGGGLVAAVMLVALVCQALGTGYILRSTTLAAWLPLLIFGPLAYVSVRRLWD
jgi:lipopolysaccharide export system permease protein